MRPSVLSRCFEDSVTGHTFSISLIEVQTLKNKMLSNHTQNHKERAQKWNNLTVCFRAKSLQNELQPTYNMGVRETEHNICVTKKLISTSRRQMNFTNVSFPSPCYVSMTALKNGYKCVTPNLTLPLSLYSYL
jgi:hypothetical protein